MMVKNYVVDHPFKRSNVREPRNLEIIKNVIKSLLSVTVKVTFQTQRAILTSRDHILFSVSNRLLRNYNCLQFFLLTGSKTSILISNLKTYYQAGEFFHCDFSLGWLLCDVQVWCCIHHFPNFWLRFQVQCACCLSHAAFFTYLSTWNIENVNYKMILSI